MIFLHIGGGAGDLNPSTNFRDGFSEFVKSHKSKDKNIFIIEANPVNINKLKEIRWKSKCDLKYSLMKTIKYYAHKNFFKNL